MKRKYLLILIAVAVLLCVIPAWLFWCKAQNDEPGETGPPEAEELLKEIRPVTVMVTAGEKHASGVIIGMDDEEVTVITAGHLMEDYEQGIITFDSGTVGFGDVEYCSMNPDMCLMTFKNEYLDESELKKLAKAQVDITKYNKLEVEDVLLLVGSAVSAGSNATQGKMAAKDFYMPDFDARMLYIYADVMAGMSGCGIYDEYGYFMGILAGGTDSGEAVAVPLDQIIEEWETIKE